MQQVLVEQAKRGDAEAFDALARLVGDRCLAIAVGILRTREALKAIDRWATWWTPGCTSRPRRTRRGPSPT